MDLELAWDVEEACSNAWPAARQRIVGGWLLRAGGGGSRRNNSVNPLRGGPADPTSVAAACEEAYAALGRDCLFRVPDLVPGMDAALDRLGYVAEGRTVTLLAELDSVPARSRAVTLSAVPDPAWVEARLAVTGGDAAMREALPATLGAVLLPGRLALSRDESRVAAVAFGAVDRGLLVIEAVATDPALRRRGHAAAVVAALADWARGWGATRACLQVEADNAPARALYAAVGFATQLYGYHYRRRALARR